MSSNYPEGSMRGSGIYAEDWSGEIWCDTCEQDVEVDGQTDDWGTTVYATCPNCEKSLEKELPSYDDSHYDDEPPNYDD